VSNNDVSEKFMVQFPKLHANRVNGMENLTVSSTKNDIFTLNLLREKFLIVSLTETLFFREYCHVGNHADGVI
jgi:hypothetical protein